ncbi:hypothetical protein ACFUAG_30895 [Streptomyces sp. NPDC057193]
MAKPDFPPFISRTKAGRVWEGAAVEEWEKGWDRTNVGGRRPSSAPQQ